MLVLKLLVTSIALTLCALAPSFAAPSAPAPHIPGTSVEMPYLIAPLTVDGKLVSYAYVSSRIVASTPAAAIDVRGATPFIQDAYVRDVNAISIADTSDPPVVDKVALVDRLLADARRIVGAAKIDQVQIIQIQFSQLRPSPRS